tara:strand:- start:1413 stop:2102 length:690 start_codon:yes stop_codon:yes gene_type:complete
MNNKKGIIVFDLDGTLINSAPDLCHALNKTLEVINIPNISIDEVMGFLGDGALELIKKGILRYDSIDNYNIDDLRKYFLKIYDKCLLDKTKFYTDAVKSIKKLRNNNFSTAICTNKPIHLAEKIINGLDASNLFDVITGGDSYNYKKPDPRHLIKTIERTGNKLNKAIMVGDSLNDIECAKKANIKSIVVNFGYSKISVEKLNADLIMKNYSDLENHVNYLINKKPKAN